MKKYLIDKWDWSTKIVEREVIKESDCSVWLSEKYHERKETSAHKYCDTWEEAHALLFEQMTQIRDKLDAQLVDAQFNYDKVSAMTKP